MDPEEQSHRGTKRLADLIPAEDEELESRARQRVNSDADIGMLCLVTDEDIGTLVIAQYVLHLKVLRQDKRKVVKARDKVVGMRDPARCNAVGVCGDHRGPHSAVVPGGVFPDVRRQEEFGPTAARSVCDIHNEGRRNGSPSFPEPSAFPIGHVRDPASCKAAGSGVVVGATDPASCDAFASDPTVSTIADTRCSFFTKWA